ncbi:hypothetical protein JIR001_07240 [Polycladomyces abyssicola]|uniref:DUF4424 domain-containing protein n=1 Tax=Polycladomyces abyssicola TaxID=1125966 RepID=A0A8D5ZN23_9BACL|nr:DUF4424 family protein [Polycladomyces abyssicola]BCU80941.1 hypothetical protein JIR001_07240 [Polycladomyces abyssicola]
MRTYVMLIFLCCSVWAILFPLPVADANGGPTITFPQQNGGLQFDPDSNIRLVSEQVHYTMHEKKPSEVEVRYQLLNESGQAKRFTILFVTPKISFEPQDIVKRLQAMHHFEVTVNGQPLSLQPAMAVMIRNWRAKIVDPVRDPIDNRPLSGNAGTQTALNGIKIPLQIRQGEALTVHFRYTPFGGYYNRDVVYPVFSQWYMLTPAAFWSGEPSVHLRVTMPSHYVLHSNIPLKQTGSGRYEAKLNRLPEKEWVLSYAKPEGLWWGTNRLWLNNVIWITVIWGIAWLILRWGMRSHRALPYLAYLVPLSLGPWQIRKIMGYPLDPIMLPLCYAFLLAVVFFLHRIMRSRLSQRQLNQNKIPFHS